MDRSLEEDAVVVTGMGVVSALGTGVESFFDALVRGETAIRGLEGIPVARGKDRAAQIAEPRYTGPGRLSRMLLDAVAEALDRSGLPLRDGAETGVFLATSGAEMKDAEDVHAGLTTSGPLPESLRDALTRFPPWCLADRVAAHFGLIGPRDSTSNACASGNVAIAQAVCAIRDRRLRRAIVCGAEQLRTAMYWCAERGGFLGHRLRSFHRDRDGTVFGEGAAALVLEALDHASARGARPLAWIAGWGMTCDEQPSVTMPQMDGGADARAMELALADAGVAPADVELVSAHSTGTVMFDRVEARAVERTFGASSATVMVHATKTLTGHLCAASPIVQAVSSILAIERQYVHPTAGLDAVDPEFRLDFVPLRGRRAKVTAVLTNAMGSGGTNAVVAIRDPRALARRASRPRAPHDAVVVTGIGALSPAGDGARALRERHESGRPSAGPLVPGFEIGRYCGEDVAPARLSRSALLAVAAAIRAAEQADLVRRPVPGRRVGVVMGTAFGGLPEWSAMVCEALSEGPRFITPFLALDHGPNLAVCLIARALGVSGPTVTLSSGPNAGLQALELASRLIREDACDAVVAGGFDTVGDPLPATLDRMLDGERFGPCRHAEGAAAFVLERRQCADARGVRHLASLLSSASAGVPTGPGRYDVRGGGLAAVARELLRPESRARRLRWIEALDGRRPARAAAARVLRRVRDDVYDLDPVEPRLTDLIGYAWAAAGPLSAAWAAERIAEGAWEDAIVASTAPGGTSAGVRLATARRGEG